MKVYAVRGGKMCSAEVPDGAMYMEIGSNTEPRTWPIVEIDWEAREYRRELGQPRPFPRSWYRDADCDWQPCAVQEHETAKR